MPDRVQANQTLDVGAVLAPRHVGSDLAMSNTDTSKEVNRIVVSAIQAFTKGTNMFTAAAIASEAITHLPSPAPRCKFCATKKELATCFDERMAASCPERTPSQAQAQTTAAQAYTRTASSGGPGVDMCWIIGGQTAAQASVLTDAVYAWVREDLSAGAQMQIGFFVQKLIDRLTVGAPAPAPTMPTREQIARVIAKDDGCDLGYSQEFVRCIREIHNCGCAKRADAILALFAEGDTP
jgi:hypothetical protein